MDEAVQVFKTQTLKGSRIINNGWVIHCPLSDIFWYMQWRSISAHTSHLHSAPYMTSKHAVSGLTRSTALDCHSHGISITQIDIGYFFSEIHFMASSDHCTGNALTPLAQSITMGTLQVDEMMHQVMAMDVQHLADAVVHITGLPTNIQVLKWILCMSPIQLHHISYHLPEHPTCGHLTGLPKYLS